MFLLDALDEMPRDSYYERFEALESFIRAHSECLFVLSCRKNDYIDRPTFPARHVILEPLSDRQIRRFLRRQLGLQGAHEVRRETTGDRAALLAQARTPFFLSLMSSASKKKSSLGGSWEIVIGDYVDSVLDQVRHDRGISDERWQLAVRDNNGMA